MHPGRAVRGAVLALGLIALASPLASAEEATVGGPPDRAGHALQEIATQPSERGEAPRRVPLSLARLEQAWWREPTTPLERRAERVRAAADALGIPDVEALARAVLIDPSLGSRRERAAAAVLLAPGLPAAQLARAQAKWSESAGFGAALGALQEAFFALSHHLESRLWLEATALTLLFVAVLAAALLWIAARGLRAAPHAAHDVSHALDPGMPDFAKAAVVAAGVLLPAALGEGILGVALVLFALGWWASDSRQRRALGAAALLVVVALGPLAGAAGRSLGSFSADPMVFASMASETGWLDPAAALRLEHAHAAGDPLATQVIARRARRTGDLAQAQALSARLLDDPGAATPALLNDAAHVRLALGDVPGAIEQYERAIELRPSADLWFNLAQAHVRALDMGSHEAALAAAQAFDPRRTGELTERLARSEETVVDLPLDSAALRARLRAAADPAAAAALRAPVAPGVIGDRPWSAGLLFAGLAAAASGLTRIRTPSRLCSDCGTRLCAHCRSGEPSDGLCAECARRRLEARHGGPWELRGARNGNGVRAAIAGIARRAAPLLPGLIEAEPRRPGWSLAALTTLAAAAVLHVGRDAIVADPAAVGAAGPLALAALAGALLSSALVLGVWARRQRTL